MNTHPPSDPIGTILQDRYRIEQMLGQGGMGIVYRGFDTQANTPIAIKALRRDKSAANPEILRRFVQEGVILRELNHPNIVSMLDAFEQDGGHYLVMDYVEGGDLNGLIEAGELPAISEILSIVIDIADALTRAHRLNILHRDIKPANVLIANDGVVKLTDFGIASFNIGTNLTEEDSLIGTVAYLSPEACMGLKLDERADIWSFGVLLYELLTGSTPFKGDHPLAVINAILRQELPDLQEQSPDIPEPLADLLYRMLVKDREGRVPSIRLIGAELEGMLKREQMVGSGRASRIQSESLFRTTPFSATLKQDINEWQVSLPTQSTRFVGRVQELAEIRSLLTQQETRLLTLLGAGGMGKTRLGIEVVEGLARQFANGAFFVDLAPLEDPDQIPRALAKAIHFVFGPEGKPEVQIFNYLEDREMLLLMDNFEHLVTGARFLSDILKHAPGVKLLVTSRTRLNLSDERLFMVSGMKIPEDKGTVGFEDLDAVELFVTYARRARPDYKLVVEERTSVVEICELMEGMPLGIQLAAAWVDTLQPAEILEELTEDVSILSSRLHDIPERQRSMQAVFNHSWRLLSEKQQDSLKRLSVFRGGFTLQAARAVAGTGVRSLSELVGRSMIQRTPEGRFHIHELIRQFLAEELSMDPAQEIITRDWHLDYYAQFLSSHRGNLIGNNSQVKDGLDSIGTDLDNCLVAWEWGVANKKIQPLYIAEFCLLDYLSWTNLYNLGHAVAKRGAEALEETGTDSNITQQLILYWKLLAWQVDWFGALSAKEYKKDWENKIDEIVDKAIANSAISELGFAFYSLLSSTSDTYYRSNAPDVLDLAQEIFERNDQLFELCMIMQLKAHYYQYILGDPKKAQGMLEQELIVAKQIDSDWIKGFTFTQFGNLWRQLGNYQEAVKSYRRALTIALETLRFGNIVWVMTIQRDLAVVLRYFGEYDESIRLLEEASRDLGEKGYRNYQFGIFKHLADVYMIIGNFSEARILLDDYLQFFKDHLRMLGLGYYSLGKLSYINNDATTALKHLEQSLKCFEDYHRREDSADAAGVLSLLGDVQRMVGQKDSAWMTFQKAISLNLQKNMIGNLMLAMLGLARFLEDEEHYSEVVEIASKIVTTMGTTHYDRKQAQALLDKLETQLPEKDFSSAKKRGDMLSSEEIYTRYWGTREV